MPTIKELKRELARQQGFERLRMDAIKLARDKAQLEKQIRQFKRPRLQIFKRVGKQIGRDIFKISKVGLKAGELVTKDILRKIDEQQKREAMEKAQMDKRKPIKRRVKKRKVVKKKVKKRRRS